MLTGVGTALVAVFLLYCTTLLMSLKQHLLVYSIQHELEKHVLFGTTFWSMVGFNLVLVAIAATLTSFGEPVAAGSVSGGLPVGKEGPMIHSGAIVAAGLSQGKSSTMGYDTSFSYFAGFRNDREKRDFVSCGAAAGVASAFGAPIGGVLFVLEEGASFWNQTLTWRTLFCAMSATFTLAFFLSGINDNLNWGTLGSHTGTFTFGPFASSTYQIWEVPLFILIGIGGGIQGALFNGVNTRLSKVRSRWIRTRRVAWVEALALSLLISSATFAVPFIFGKCNPLPQIREDLTHLTQPGAEHNKAFSFAMETLHRNGTACICESCANVGLDGADCFQADDTVEYPYKKELVRFYCRKGEYNDLASLMLSSGEIAIKHLFHAPPNSFDVSNLVIFWGVMMVLACITYGLKVPSGLFVPALLIGAAYGRLWTRVINYFTAMLKLKTVDPRTYGLVGSCAMLGGVTRMTISLTVIILECTGNIEYGLPLILTSFFARWVGNYFNEGIYDIHIHLRHVPFLDWNPSLRGFFLRVKHIMTMNPKTLRTVERAGVIFDLLVSTKHNAFPVIVEDPTFGNRFFAGVILRKQLNVLLSHRDFSTTKPKPFSRKPPPSERSQDREDGFRRANTSSESDDTPRSDDMLLRSPTETDATYCLSYRDMEAHYPRYPTPTLFPDRTTAFTGSDGDQMYTLSEDDRSLWVDLTPYINQTPYLIQEEAPFVRAYRLFRSAGLRHLVVVNRHNNVRGIITRRDLQDEHCTRSFRLAKNVDPEDLYPLSGAPPVSFFRQLRRTVSRSDQVKRVLGNTKQQAREENMDTLPR
ncbi:Chloride channel, partial [Globisporangium splendens]